MSTDSDWEKWGELDPYFGIITKDEFRSHNLSEEAKAEFFESGKREIDHVIEICRHHLDETFSPGNVLDFGCGAGRHVLAFSKIADHVVGLDVSDSMLKEALGNCNEHSVHNVTLLKADDNLSSLHESFDFIFSYIVLQHIPVKRGKIIFANLLKHLGEGGVFVVHCVYARTFFRDNYGLPRAIDRLKKRTGRLFRNLLHRLHFTRYPEMQMNLYDLNELLFLVQQEGIRDVHVEFTDHGGELGAWLYFQRTRSA